MSRSRSQIDDPIGVSDHREVVLDDDYRFTGVNKAVEQIQQVVDIGEVESGCGLIENVDAAFLRHVDGQLEPLALPARQGVEGLADAEVSETDLGEQVKDVVSGRNS